MVVERPTDPIARRRWAPSPIATLRLHTGAHVLVGYRNQPGTLTAIRDASMAALNL